jgi:hypothetical protein
MEWNGAALYKPPILRCEEKLQYTDESRPSPGFLQSTQKKQRFESVTVQLRRQAAHVVGL